MSSISFLEFYNLLVEEAYHGQKPLVFADETYLKIQLPQNVKWDFFTNNRPTLEYKKYRHLKNPPLYIISIDLSPTERNDEILYLDGPLDQFLSKFPLINSTLDLPAAVNDQIYLGALRHLKREIITSLNIRLIISAGAKPETGPDPNITDFCNDHSITCIFIDVDDEKTSNLFEHFEKTSNLIDQFIQKGESIFVHCYMGRSRSTSLVTAYLIKKGASFQKAGNIITDARRIAKPNQGFINQLMEWEMLCHGRQITSESQIPF